MIDKEAQRQKAAPFLTMHQSPPILVLGNVWDVISARIHEAEGFRALGTTSAGISATLGYPDAQHMSLTQNLEVIRRIVASVSIPVSADVEAGYGDEPESVAATTQAVIEIGAAGLNLEDAPGLHAALLYETSRQCDRIRAARAAADAAGLPLVINARTDVFLISHDHSAESLRQAIDRGNAYRSAGADCVFVPGFEDFDRDALRTLVAEIDAPLNIIAGPGTPPIPELAALGVARVSFGPRYMRVLLASLCRMTRELLEEGTYTALSEETLSYADMNELLGSGGRGSVPRVDHDRPQSHRG